MQIHLLALMLALTAAIIVSAGAETPVVLDLADQRNATVSGDVVAWDDTRNGDRDVYVKDLVTGAETRVGSPGTDETNPDIDGSHVVYASAGDILLYDTATGTTTTVCSSPGEQSHPRISGTRIVWEDRRGSDLDIYSLDRSTGTERLMTSSGAQHSPSVDGNQMVWVSEGSSSGETSVVVYDAASDSTFLIAATGNPSVPDLGGGAVTYLGWDGGRQRVYRRGITGGTAQAVSAVTGDHRAQRIDGARVAIEAGGSASGIWIYSMNFGTATRVDGDGGGAADRNPSIDGTRVVWETDRNGNWDVYTATVDSGTVTMPLPTVTAGQTIEPAPTSSRFGTRRYVVGAVPQDPPTGAAAGTGSTIATAARTRDVMGSGTATGTTPPTTRFVRWSPLARWRTGAR